MKTAKIKIATLIMSSVLAIMPLATTACSLFGPSENDIDIIDSNISYTNNGTGLRVTVTIQNNYSSTIKTSFNVNIYQNGAVFDSAISNVLTLGAGETGTLSSITLIYQYDNYTFNITNWNFYNV